MAYDAVKTIRVNSVEWQSAQSICDELHVSMSSLINVFIKQIIVQRRVPIGIALDAPSEPITEVDVPLGILEDAPAAGLSLLQEEKPIDLDQHQKYKDYASQNVNVDALWGSLLNDLD